MKQSRNVKIQVYVPLSHAKKVRLAIGDAGGGHVGKYSHCVFVTEGTGYFLPLKGANPHIGHVGKIQSVREAKIEFICTASKAAKIIKAIKRVHPYEEVALDVIPLVDDLMND
ncbi:MAG: hypothetical protein WC604_02105 [Candidatus Gracilibacteria bacterium]